MTDDNSMLIHVRPAHPSRWVQIPTDIELDAAINMLIEHWPRQPWPPADSDDIQPSVTVAKFDVGCLPPTDIDAHTWGVTVEHDGRGTWAVRSLIRQCLNTDGEWDVEPMPSDRDNEWRATHRFPLAEALVAAKEAAPDIEVNGLTAADLAKRKARRG